MDVQLPDHIERSIHAAVRDGHFASTDDAMTEAARLLLKTLHPEEAAASPAVGEGANGPTHKPIWEEILEATADIPDEVWDQLPTDLAEQHDHYIYGTPRRRPSS
jgi:Arc/MetJ-type ribon-helix-helix transcriptional regulator